MIAFQEVEETLLIQKCQNDRRELIFNFLLEARKTQRTAQDRYSRGLIDYLTLLEAQQTRFSAEQKLIEVDMSILANRVRLYRVLSGKTD